MSAARVFRGVPVHPVCTLDSGWIWRIDQINLLDGEPEPMGDDWPRAGLLRSGTAYSTDPIAPLTRQSEDWPTPAARDWKDTGANVNWEAVAAKSKLAGVVQMREKFPTPQASDHRDRGNLSHPSIQRRKRLGKQLNLSMVVSPVSGSLNPDWVEWLMGFPVGWSDLKVNNARGTK